MAIRVVILIFKIYWSIVDLKFCVSAVQQSESVIHISTLLGVFFSHIGHYRVLRSSLCYTVDPYWLSILYKIVCQSQSPNLSLPP